MKNSQVVVQCARCGADLRRWPVHVRNNKTGLFYCASSDCRKGPAWGEHVAREGFKTCCTCDQEKPTEDFYRNASRPDGLQLQCKPCSKSHLQRWRAKNPARNAEYIIRWKYGLSLEEYHAFVDRPCELCGATNVAFRDGRRSIVLDHDHDTGKVRGPLCHACNKAIGAFGDNPARLRAAADYLERHRHT